MRIMKTPVRSGRLVMAVALGLALSVLPVYSGGTQQERAVMQDERVTFPLEEQITLSYYTPLGFKFATVISSHSEIEAYQLLEEMTNVRFDFIHPPVGEQVNQLNLMIAADDLPDIVVTNWFARPGGPERAISDGTIVDIAPYAEQHAPNYVAMLDSDEVYRKGAYTDSGSLPAFYTLWGELMRVNLGLAIRNDWLRKIDRDVPRTLEEWYEVLTLFARNDVNGSGDPNDEIPFSTHRLWQDERAFLYAFDLAPDNNGFFAHDGTVRYTYAEPAYREYLIEMKKWYDEGLLDPEFASNTRPIFDAKMMNDRVGAAFAGAGMGFSGYFYQAKRRGGDEDFEFVGAPALESVYGRPAPFGHQANPVGGATSITPKNRHLAETIAVLDYGYSPDGNLMMLYGSPGVVYEMDNGQIRYTDYATNNPDGLTFDQVLCLHGLAAQSGGPTYHHGEFWMQSVSFMPQTQEMLRIWADVDTSYKMNYVTNTPEEVREISARISDITTYADEMYLGFIMGTESTDRFDEYVQQLYTYGLNEVLEIMQRGYDRYLTR